MALWMEAGSEPKTDTETADLDAIAALKESAAVELKEKGNECVKKGKKYYSDAIDCYTRAINQKALSDADQSILHSNRAHVNLLLGNNRRALQDAEEAIKLNPANVKAFYRAAKASVSLNLLDEAKSYCEKGLEQSSSNDDLKKLAKQIDTLKYEQERREAEISKAIAAAKGLISAFEDRNLKIGKAMYRELTGLKKPRLDKNNILHWPVVLLYPEAGSEVPLSKKELLRYLLEGTTASHLESFDDEDINAAQESTSCSTSLGNNPKWVKVDERRTLHNVLKEPNLVIPGVPVFFVVSRKSSFYKTFKSGNWSF
ncbi:PREDICTED: tetratricopeptide repeat protein 4 homolog isoform X2 [Ipomoea nil]|uniref:tetratricopeptide repeat protein 4 homolog isoform X2 n=1 Tax=Ipomoea nil TaxID=35883 RepID=UPI000901B0D8|nr:PREDICTED: tetratricopeptide repeat protein 4 homolog isoform X2 [Ipomoea nil]